MTASVDGDRADRPRQPGAAGAIISAIASLLVFSIGIPVYIAFLGLVRSAPFFGEQPSAAELAQSAALIWAALAVSLASLVAIIALAFVSRRRRGAVALVVLAVLATLFSGIWTVAGSSAQCSADSAATAQSPSATPAPSPEPTIVDGRYLPTAQGSAAAAALISRLSSVSFPSDASPDQASRLVAAAGGDDPETAGVGGEVAVGVFVGDQTCVLGRVRAGRATWSVVGLSTDGGCLGPHHA